MSDVEPPTVGYAGRTRRPAAAEFRAGTLVLAAGYFLTVNVIESLTRSYVAAHDGLVGPFWLPTDDVRHFQVHGDVGNTLAEVAAWSLPATGLFTVAVALIPPRCRWRLQWPTTVTLFVGGLAYSCVRWGVELVAHVEFGEAIDFGIAMFLATAAGITTGLARRWS